MTTTRILGIDPGLRSMGWGVILRSGSTLRYVASGTVEPPKTGAMGDRLLALAGGLEDVVGRHAPDCASLEETYVNSGPRSALALGQARGVCLMVLANAHLEVGEYAPAVIKKAVVGTGRADKRQVQAMVARLLPGSREASPDAADALAIAICHASHTATTTRLSA